LKNATLFAAQVGDKQLHWGAILTSQLSSIIPLVIQTLKPFLCWSDTALQGPVL